MLYKKILSIERLAKIMIKVNGVTFKYKENKAIDNINLEIKEEEFVAIIGINGSREI